jgi:mRNA-degrading endonuclease RelE of RelBE toxin-antitoxin system
MTFKIFLNRKTAKLIEGLNPRDRERVKEGLKSLEGFPAGGLNIVKISGEDNVYRIRFGKLRALFKVYRSEKAIVIIKIDHRKRVYG